MITSINESKTLIKSIFHKTINVNLMVENIIQVKSGVIINTDVGAKIQWSIVYVKKIMFGIACEKYYWWFNKNMW